MKKSPKLIGLLQSLSLAAYVAFFAIMIQAAQPWLARKDTGSPALGMVLFLLLFVTSALICASIMLSYPATLFFEGKKKQALEVVGWSIVWLIGIVIIAAIVVARTGSGV